MHLVHLVVDAANVVGSRPDGWWRDRAGAAARLVDQVEAALRSGRLGSEAAGSGSAGSRAAGPVVTVVLEGAARAGVRAGPSPVGYGRPDLTGVRRSESDGTRSPERERTRRPEPEGARRSGSHGAEHETGSGVADLVVVHAERDGDSAIVALVSSLVAGGARALVITADRGLRAQVVAEGAEVLGPSWLLDRL